MNLIIVESPTKAKTIKNYAGKDFKVISSKGHIIDLPEKELGIDIENDFNPQFKPIKSKKGVISSIKKESKKADEIYIATDPDREGEAIAYFINSVIDKDSSSIKRVLFYEITKKGIQNGLNNPRTIDQNLVNSQFTRRILDRLVGYQISPFLWRAIKTGLSAGRVQSVALRLICEKEDKIDKFKPKKFFKIKGDFDSSGSIFEAELLKYDGIKTADIDIDKKEDVKKTLLSCAYNVNAYSEREKKQSPPPPFITSTLQQAAANIHSFSAKKTMRTAQQLYEGVEINGKQTGLITYMRTDSVRLADEAIDAIRDSIAALGKQYLPPKPRYFKKGKSSQDAHEAIRPSDVTIVPEDIESFLTKDQFRIYALIWKRAIACQMKEARFNIASADIVSGKHLFRATGTTMLFDGFLKIYPYSNASKDKNEVPVLKNGQDIDLKTLHIKEDETKPPPRFTDASLVKILEKEGIGRPSTYASIIDILLRRNYVSREQKKFIPTELGRIVSNVLVDYFGNIVNVKFTAQLEEKLDSIVDAQTDKTQILKTFYDDFKSTLDNAMQNSKNIKKNLQEETDIKCEKCGSPMIVKWGRYGKFLACSNYPSCKNTKPFEEEDNSIDEKCPKCGKDLVIKRGRFGRFIACSNYPTCKFTKPLSTGVKCPQCEDGEIVEKQTAKGRLFWGCSNYPKCKFATWNKPLQQTCPECGNPYMEQKGSNLQCPKCKHRQSQ